MGWPSFKHLCKTSLGLNSAAEEALKAAAKTILKERDNWFTEQKDRTEQGIYDLNTLYQLAAAYVEEGWNTATVKLCPGKNFWTGSDIGSSKRVYIYPQDKKSIYKGVQRVFAKIQAQEKDKQRAKHRAEKRKRDEEAKSVDELELPGKNDFRKGMTPQTDQMPERRSDRIKQNTYTTWNFNLEDFRRPTTTQARERKASSNQDQDRKPRPQRTFGRRGSSTCEHDKPRVKPSKQSLWPSARSCGPHQVPLTTPTHPSLKAAPSQKTSNTKPVDVAWSSTPEVETRDRDTVSPDEIQSMMKSLAPQTFQKPLCQPNSDDIPVGLPPLENISSVATSSKASNGAKSASKPYATLVRSKDNHLHKKLRLNNLDQIPTTETGPHHPH